MENKSSNNRIPDQDPSKAMDSRKEVEQSNDNKIDQDFPGYPHYPAKEDIMDQRTDSHRVDLDVENLANGPNTTGVNQRFAQSSDRNRNESGDTAEQDDAAPAGTNSRQAEIGMPQNVSNEDLGEELPGTDPDEAEEQSR